MQAREKKWKWTRQTSTTFGKHFWSWVYTYYSCIYTTEMTKIFWKKITETKITLQILHMFQIYWFSLHFCLKFEIGGPFQKDKLKAHLKLHFTALLNEMWLPQKQHKSKYFFPWSIEVAVTELPLTRWSWMHFFKERILYTEIHFIST